MIFTSLFSIQNSCLKIMLSPLIHFDFHLFVLELLTLYRIHKHRIVSLLLRCHVCDALKNYHGLCSILLLLAIYNNVQLQHFGSIHFTRMKMSAFGVCEWEREKESMDVSVLHSSSRVAIY